METADELGIVVMSTPASDDETSQHESATTSGNKLTKRQQTLLKFLYSASNIRTPTPSLKQGIAALLGAQATAVNAWFREQRARERRCTVQQFDDTAIEPIHSMGDMVTISDRLEFSENVNRLAAGSRLPSKVVSALKARAPTKPPAAVKRARPTAVESLATTELHEAVRVVRGGGSSARPATGVASNRNSHQYSEAHVLVLAQTYARFPQLATAEFRNSPEGVRCIEQCLGRLNNQLQKKQVVEWMKRRPHKIPGMIFAHEDALDHACKLLRSGLINHLAKYVIPHVLADPKLLLQSAFGSSVHRIWLHVAPDEWQEFARTSTEEFVRSVPDWILHRLDGAQLRRLLRSYVFVWQQRLAGGFEPVWTWESFHAFPFLLQSAVPIMQSDPDFLTNELETESQAQPWHTRLFAPASPVPPVQLWRLLQRCVLLAQLERELTDATLQQWADAIHQVLVLFSSDPTSMRRNVMMSEIYHTTITIGKQWFEKFESTATEQERAGMSKAWDSLMRWLSLMQDPITEFIQTLMHPNDATALIAQFFSKLHDYLQRRPQPVAAALGSINHPPQNEAVVAMAAAPFHIPSLENLNASLVLMGKELARSAQRK